MFPLLFPIVIGGFLVGAGGATVTMDGCELLPGTDTHVREDGSFGVVVKCNPGGAMIMVDGRPTGVTLDVLPGHSYLGLVVDAE